MAASVANSRKLLTSGETTKTSTSFTSTSGDTIWVAVSDQSGQGTVTISDNKGNTYSQIGSTTAGGSGGQLRRFHCVNITGGSSHTVTATWASNSDAVVVILHLTGVTSSPYDSAASNSNGDGNPPWTTTSGTLAQADSIALSAVAGAYNGTWSESAGFTIDQQEGDANLYWTAAGGHLVVNATTALTPSWTISGGGSDAAVCVDIYKASGGSSLSVTANQTTAATTQTSTLVGRPSFTAAQTTAATTQTSTLAARAAAAANQTTAATTQTSTLTLRGALSASQTTDATTQTATLARPAWTPANLSADRAWYVSDNPSNTLNSGNLDTLADKGNLSLPAGTNQSITTNRAALTTTLNSRSVWTVNPASSTLKGYFRAGTNTLARNATGVSLFAVYRQTSSGVSAQVLHLDRDDGYVTRAVYGRNADASAFAGGRRLNADSYQDYSTASSEGTGWIIGGAVIDYANTTVTIYTDATQRQQNTSFQTAGSTTDTSSLYLSIGHYTNTSNVVENPITGDFAEVLVVRGAVSSTDRQRIEGYLAWEWGLQAQLPSGHPYKDARPMLDSSLSVSASQTTAATTQTSTLAARAALSASQTDAATTQTSTLAARASVTAAQTTAAASQTATVAVTYRVSAAQTTDANAQTATLTLRGALSAAQTNVGTSQTATIALGSVLLASQTTAATTQTATLAARASVTAAQTDAATTQTATLAARAALSAAQTTDATTQTATLDIQEDAALSAAQTTAATTQTATLTLPGGLTAVQTTVAPAQASTVVVLGQLSAAQTTPLTTQTAALANRPSIVSAQTTADTSQVALLLQNELTEEDIAALLELIQAILNAYAEEGPAMYAFQVESPTTQGATFTVRVAIAATQMTVAVTPLATLAARASVTAAQTNAATTQTATLALGAPPSGIIAGQTTVAPTQAATLAVRASLVATQTTQTATQAAVLTAGSPRVSAAQTTADAAQTATLALGSLPRQVTASQTTAAATQVATVTTRQNVVAAQTTAATSQTATFALGTLPAGFHAIQTTDPTTQTATVTTRNTVVAAQVTQATSQTSTVTSRMAVSAAQTTQPTTQTVFIGLPPLGVQAAQITQATTQAATAIAIAKAQAAQTTAATTQVAALAGRIGLSANQLTLPPDQLARLRHEYELERNGRTLDVIAEDRTFGIQRQDRSFTHITAENRAHTIGE